MDQRRSILGLVLAVGIASAMAGPSAAQDEIRNFRAPILAVDTGGHHARVRSLLWQDDVTLISGGEDKVVRVWDLREPTPRLQQSIRPMIWRGLAGTINAMALSPKPDGRGQRFLAVAGSGVSAERGDLTVYRLPGLRRIPTGDVVARRTPPDPSRPQEMGHHGPIACLAFDPTGRILASGGTDGTIVLWDVPTFRPIAMFRPPPRIKDRPSEPIRALGFRPDGRRLATGGADGALRIWDVETKGQVASLGGTARNPNQINAVAYTPDASRIVVGFELPGVMFVVRADTLAVAGPPWQPGRRGPFEAMTVLPDAAGPRVAVSVKTDPNRVPDPARMACDLEIRNLDTREVRKLREGVAGLVYAVAISPNGRRLAYAGGTNQAPKIEDQAIRILDLTAIDRDPIVIRGQGTSTYDVRFSAESKTVGFLRRAIDPAAPLPETEEYEAFRLDRHEPATIPRRDLPAGFIDQYQGWSIVRGAQPWQLIASRADGRPSTTISIDVATERQAWSWTIIPGDPQRNHPRPTLAIGTESGVAVFDLETGRRTRVFAGHDAPVVALAPSPDGRWLASGSIDQTIRLYPLDGSDARGPLGVELRPRADGAGMFVASVRPRTYAAAMGLVPGDEVVQVGVGYRGERAYYKTPDEIQRFLDRLPELDPGLAIIGFEVRRTLSIPGVGPVTITIRRPTTQRDNPVLSLFLGRDREWVFWTPRGHYETSIEGDARFLGWHLNPPYATDLPTDFFAIGAFAEAMNRRDVLDRVWQTGVLDPAPAVAAAPERAPVVVAAEDQPPRILFEPPAGAARLPAPGVTWVVNQPNPRIAIRLTAGGKSPILGRRIFLDERPLPLNAPVEPVREWPEVVPVANLAPNRPIRLAVEASNAAGRQRTESIDLIYVPPAVAPVVEAGPASRLHRLAIGCETFAAGLPPVAYADRDARALSEWLAGHLTAADGSIPSTAEPPKELVGPAAVAASIDQAIAHLHSLVLQKKVGPRDVVAVVIASHLLAAPGGVAIAGADTIASSGPEPRPVVSADDLAVVLGQLADYGCRVVVLVDGLHRVDPPLRSAIKPFVRDLQRKRGAIVFVASKEGPSGVNEVRQQGNFTLGVLNVFEGAKAGAPLTLDQFRMLVQRQVSDLSSRRQLADGYFPARLAPRTPFVRAK